MSQSDLWRQCAWCHKMLTGPLIGKYVHLRHGESHGICKSCKNQWLAKYRIRKRDEALNTKS